MKEKREEFLKKLRQSDINSELGLTTRQIDEIMKVYDEIAVVVDTEHKEKFNTAIWIAQQSQAMLGVKY